MKISPAAARTSMWRATLDTGISNSCEMAERLLELFKRLRRILIRSGTERAWLSLAIISWSFSLSILRTKFFFGFSISLILFSFTERVALFVYVLPGGKRCFAGDLKMGTLPLCRENARLFKIFVTRFCNFHNSRCLTSAYTFLLSCYAD